MVYFKFTDQEDNEMYGKIYADREKVDLEKVKDLLHAKNLEEVSREEYDDQTENDGEDLMAIAKKGENERR